MKINHKKGVVINIMSDRVRVTFELPKKLLEFVDKECEKESTEIMILTRSSFLRKLIIEARDGRKEGKKEGKDKETLKWNMPKEKVKESKEDVNSGNSGYDDLLELSGYRR